MRIDIAKYLAIGLTILGMLVGATWLVSDALADTKSWTLKQDAAIKEEVLNNVDRHYVPKEDFTKVEAQIEGIKEQNTREHDSLMKQLDRIERNLRKRR